MLETLVDFVSFIGEMKQGIPVTVFFTAAMDPRVYVFHLTTVAFIVCTMCYAFLTIPRTLFFCENPNPCSCANLDFVGLEDLAAVCADLGGDATIVSV